MFVSVICTTKREPAVVLFTKKTKSDNWLPLACETIGRTKGELTEEGWLYCFSGNTQNTFPTKRNFNSVHILR